MQLKIKRLHPDAILPRYATSGAAGLDLHAVGINRDDLILTPGEAMTVRTGVAIEVPHGWVGLVFSRSGHGFKHGVRLANAVGVIDSDYRGELMVRLHNDGRQALPVRHGDRIAQVVLMPAPQVTLIEVDRLSDTGRGTGGMGSTGQ